ncbi:hypothetical protein BDM02DRAFT_3133256 [Thelephora ganbajun]|uniref:Uncharacterized protein n=1 Tax=Thelephora ganbajun TaxID=370292 RepID=A0ACB6YY55_THEGA|nr:hypothetical protein BDM02DRAFT_3133256 [Thelephora ganbajun]
MNSLIPSGARRCIYDRGVPRPGYTYRMMVLVCEQESEKEAKVYIVPKGIEAISLPFDLTRSIYNDGPLSLKDTLRVMTLDRIFTDTLSAVHASGVIHCDIKSENVAMKEPIVIDWGLVAVAEEALYGFTPGFIAPHTLDDFGSLIYVVVSRYGMPPLESPYGNEE